MKKALLFIFSLVFALMATAKLTPASDMGSINGTDVPIDTISYALGQQYTLGSMAGNNNLMKERKDFEDYVRALEDFLPEKRLQNDAAYMTSYVLGSMQGIFMTDGRSQKDLMNELPCVVKGLRKVADGTIVLPEDTIQAMNVINRYKPITAMELEGDQRCEYMTAIGIMTAFRPGLQEYVDEMAPGKQLTANRQAFVAGMSDLLDLTLIGEPTTAYDFGRMIAGAVKFEFIKLDNLGDFDKASFIAGAKAALQLGEELIPRDIAEAAFDKMAGARPFEKEGLDHDKFEELMKYRDSLKVELDTSCSVYWKVKAAPVASVGSSATEAFEKFLKNYLPDAVTAPGALMAFVPDDTELFVTLTSTIGKTPLKNGYRWFCSRNSASELIVGITNTEAVFEAIAGEASIDFNSHFGAFQLTWKYDKGTAALWEQFTEDNIGKYVAVEINDKFIMAPKVNTAITSGECAASDVLPETVNELFKDAIPIAEDIEEIPIEPIDIE